MRLPVDSTTNRMRGFGYAEFDTVDNLMEALSLNKEVILISTDIFSHVRKYRRLKLHDMCA